MCSTGNIDPVRVYDFLQTSHYFGNLSLDTIQFDREITLIILQLELKFYIIKTKH